MAIKLVCIFNFYVNINTIFPGTLYLYVIGFLKLAFIVSLKLIILWSIYCLVWNFPILQSFSLLEVPVERHPTKCGSQAPKHFAPTASSQHFLFIVKSLLFEYDISLNIISTSPGAPCQRKNKINIWKYIIASNWKYWCSYLAKW